MGELACGYCGIVVSVDAVDDSKLHHDHIVPRSRGGSDHADNCIVTCRRCNLEKHDRTPSEWKPTGLPEWIYEIEATLVARFKMKSRSKARTRITRVEVPGFSLVKADGPVCLEQRDRGEGHCYRSATHEVSIAGDAWNARCYKCVRFYSERVARELDHVSYVLHTLVQLQCGTLPTDAELALLVVARNGRVSIAEFLELAIQVVRGDDEVREALFAVAPALRLELWRPVTREERST